MGARSRSLSARTRTAHHTRLRVRLEGTRAARDAAREATAAARAESLALSQRLSQGEALREAIRSWAEADLEMEDLSYGERLRRSGLIGCLDDAPADLSANPRHMEGFGE